MTDLTEREGLALKPCPFCDGHARVISGGPGNYYVRCDFCACQTDDGSRERAIASWNRRAALKEDRP